MLSRAEMQRDSERQQTRQSEEQRHVSNDNGATSSEWPLNLRRSKLCFGHLELGLRGSKRVTDLDWKASIVPDGWHLSSSGVHTRVVSGKQEQECQSCSAESTLIERENLWSWTRGHARRYCRLLTVYHEQINNEWNTWRPLTYWLNRIIS